MAADLRRTHAGTSHHELADQFRGSEGNRLRETGRARSAAIAVQGMAKDEKRILVVDDDDAIRTLLLTILRRRGMAVDTAKNGAEALQKLGRCSYAVILLDLMMPVISGWQVLEKLATFEPARRPLVIVLTAGSESRDFSPDLVIGSIRKPFDVELLTDMVSGCAATVSEKQQLADCPAPDSDQKGQSSDSN